MAWPWKDDIDKEKRTPGIIVKMSGHITHRGFRAKGAEKELRELGVRAGCSVMDFQCGAGVYAIAAARIAGAGGTVHAVGLHPASLEMLEKKAKSAGLHNVDTIYSDLDTGIAASSVDFVILHGIIDGKKRVSGLLSEAHRVIKADGLLLLVHPGKDDGRINDMLLKDGFFCFAGRQGRVMKYRKIVGSFKEVS